MYQKDKSVWRVILLTLFICVLLSMVITVAHSHVAGHDWAQLPPNMQRWLKDQKQPGSKFPCCDDKDGEEVEEDLVDGQYRIRSTKTGGQWLPVPNAVVIREPNLWGRPIAWFRWHNGQPVIFCYAPGSLM